ncbi:hypothetical protein H4S07_002215, partial [Coemansia furcata]
MRLVFSSTAIVLLAGSAIASADWNGPDTPNAPRQPRHDDYGSNHSNWWDWLRGGHNNGGHGGSHHVTTKVPYDTKSSSTCITAPVITTTNKHP